jgi:hypothetical protein
MTLDEIEQALKSLKGWPNRIGIIGGEPTLHPQFNKVCDLLMDYNPPGKYGLWTTGGPAYEKHDTVIRNTFGFLAHNEHTAFQKSVCKHQPITIASGDVVEDKKYLKYLIDTCWVQLNWCPSIGPKGAFFCEVAYALDTLLDGPGGYPVEPGWWMKEPLNFQDQVERYCHLCGMPVPLRRQVLENRTELITPAHLKRFKKHNLKRIETDKDFKLFNDKLSAGTMEETRMTWDPRNYRGDLYPDGQCYKY